MIFSQHGQADALARFVRGRGMLWGVVAGLAGLLGTYLWFTPAAGWVDAYMFLVAASLPAAGLGALFGYLVARLGLRWAGGAAGGLRVTAGTGVKIGLVAFGITALLWPVLYVAVIMSFGGWSAFTGVTPALLVGALQLTFAMALPAAAVALLAVWHTDRAVQRRFRADSGPSGTAADK